MDLSQRRAVLKEVSPQERRQQFRDYAAGRPLAPARVASLQRWAEAYPPFGYVALLVGAGLAAAFVVPLLSRAHGQWLVPVVVLVLWVAWMYQAVRHLQLAARVRREAGLAGVAGKGE